LDVVVTGFVAKTPFQCASRGFFFSLPQCLVSLHKQIPFLQLHLIIGCCRWTKFPILGLIRFDVGLLFGRCSLLCLILPYFFFSSFCNPSRPFFLFRNRSLSARDASPAFADFFGRSLSSDRSFFSKARSPPDLCSFPLSSFAERPHPHFPKTVTDQPSLALFPFPQTVWVLIYVVFLIPVPFFRIVKRMCAFFDRVFSGSFSRALCLKRSFFPLRWPQIYPSTPFLAVVRARATSILSLQFNLLIGREPLFRF